MAHSNGRLYSYDQSTLYRSLDVFAREYRAPYSDRTISVVTGKFRKLKVQATDNVRNGPGGSTWKRRRIKNVGPKTLRLSNWVVGHSEQPDKLWRDQQWAAIVLAIAKSIAISPLTVFTNIFVSPSGGEEHNGWRYDPVPYRYFGRAKTLRNPKDDSLYLDEPNLSHGHGAGDIQLQSAALTADRTAIPATAVVERAPRSASDRTERVLLPRRLVWLDTPPVLSPPDEEGIQYKTYPSTDVKTWMKKHNLPCPEYLFVAYRSTQFEDDEDYQKLHEMARQATKGAGLGCYWLSGSCIDMSMDRKQYALDIWRMSDVLRGAHSMVICLGTLPETDSPVPFRAPSKQSLFPRLLSSWAESIWTFPELLLSKGDHITCYMVETPDPSEPEADLDDLYEGASSFFRKEVTPKSQFAANVLATPRDRYSVRRLLDHFSGNLRLSDLELTTVALECFSSRQAGRQFLPGDYSYALMGLLGRRPPVHASDTAFLAFARLSLENYNNRLFERMICLLQGEDQKWFDTTDLYGARLWDIEPSVQIAGIGVYDEKNLEMDANDFEFEEEYLFGDILEDEKPKLAVRQFSNESEKHVPPAFHAAMPSQGSFSSQAPIFQQQQQVQYNPHVQYQQAEYQYPGQEYQQQYEQKQLPPDPYGPSSTKSEHTAYHSQAEVAEEQENEHKEHVHDHNILTEDDVVILDGCHAAAVHWRKFEPVAHGKYPSFIRKLVKWILRLNFIFLIIGTILASNPLSPYSYSSMLYFNSGSSHSSSRPVELSPIQSAGVFFLLIFFLVQFASPFLVRLIYGGKFWITQPWFFGFEGYLPLHEVEALIWGANLGRLSWSFYASSPLSIHRLDSEGRFVVSEDPTKVPATRALVEKARTARPGDMRIFTLVDTYSMTVTLFAARRPPEALLICGSEGGMQRALGCSFEWTTQTFYKETVLRLETRVLDKMDRIRRVRLGVKRMEKGTRVHG